MTNPHPDNFCGGAYYDWLEILLLTECNGSCRWCIEAGGYHPTSRAPWDEIVRVALSTGKPNVILLGGEPTIYPRISDVIARLSDAGRHVYTTTNGSRLSPEFVSANLSGLEGINISIHHDDLARNRQITGIVLDRDVLRASIAHMHSHGTSVRLNCNLIDGQIDTHDGIRRFVGFAKDIGADSVRFAELKFDSWRFVDAHEVTGDRYGLNDEPFTCRCNTFTEIDGMPVNFRQMCGLQTEERPAVTDPKMQSKDVLYYDGRLYPGWQCAGNLSDIARDNIVADVAAGRARASDVSHLFDVVWTVA